ncbi:MAG: DUF5108 domain-containing protein [Paludibacter sp.]|jgi:uncharacterized surface protein with fasciclin (FAS1) repeats|nr:DUF5108 domain-containing protein [Paludibacter sp.]
MKKYIFTIVASSLLFITACNDPFMNTTYVEGTGANTELSNAEFLQKNKDRYSLWIELLQYANLYNALNDASSTSTVFAPNNAAVEEFLAWRGVSSVEELDKNYARYVAQVHIMKGILKENDFIAYAESGSIPVMTLFGSYLATSYGFKNTDVDDEFLGDVTLEDPLSIYLNNQARVERLGHADTTANGTVYTLESVIRPLSETVLDVMKTMGEFDIFVEAAEKTDYDKIVQVYADTVINPDGSISVNDIRFTCLAVPDKVYKSAGINSAADLASHLGAGSDYTNPANALYRYIAYHFLGKTYTKESLADFEEEGEVNIYDTKLAGNVITVQDEGGGLKINSAAGIIRSNIKARNGVIHKIDNIMPVYEPEPLKVMWDFCNASDIESFVNAYGAAKQLGELFSNIITNKEYQIDLSEDLLEGNYGKITSFVYKASAAKSSNKSWRKVGFFKCSYVGPADKINNKYGAYKDNLFILNLGYAGNITMQTPTIIKGKYKVVMHYAGAPGLKTFYPNGSNTRFNLDDYQKSIFMWKGIPATFDDPAKKTSIDANGIASDVLWDEVVFEQSGVHTFKATMMDINAKTNGSYRQMWDYLEFIPIK